MKVNHIILACGLIAMIVGMESRGTTFVMGMIWAIIGGIMAERDERRLP